MVLSGFRYTLNEEINVVSTCINVKTGVIIQQMKLTFLPVASLFALT